MDRLELVMQQGQPDQWIERILGMDKAFQVRKFIPDDVFTHRRRIDGFPCYLIFNHCSGYFPDINLPIQQDAAYLSQEHRRKRPCFHHIVPPHEGLTVAQSFLRMRIDVP